jgi:GNAT superfamily N-acetyltransferase
MAIKVETDNAEVLAVLDAVVAADAVRNTVLATILEELRRTRRDAWCAYDGAAVAARSETLRPVALSAGWSDLDGLADALAGLHPLTGLGGPIDTVAGLVERLGRPVTGRGDERLFRCDRVAAPAGVRGAPRLAAEADTSLIAAWRPPYLLDVFGRVPPGFDSPAWAADLVHNGRVWLWLDETGEPVSHAAIRAPVAEVARSGPVYTPPEHRGRGYGSAVTAQAARDILDDGDVPVLFTDLANPTSNQIYRAIGFRPVADRAAVWFG